MRKNLAIALVLGLLLVFYLVVVGQLVPHANQPTPSRPAQQVWPPRRQSFLFDLAPLPQLQRGDVSQGTAFNIDGAGLWLTARHVVSPCLAGQFRGQIDDQPITLVSADGDNDIALVRTGGRPLAHEALHVSFVPRDEVERATIVGFPGNRPAEVAVERIGWGVARSVRGSEDISVWVEDLRSPPGDYPLSGMSGAPVLDDLNNVIGVLSAEVPRRGRVLVARIGDWVAAENPRIVPERTFVEDRPMGGLVGQLTGNRAIARLRCSS